MNDQTDELDDEGIEVETEDTSSESQVASTSTESSDDDEDELGSYSRKVRKRIAKMTEKLRAVESEREEAARVAQQIYNENQQLKQRVQGLDTGYLNEYGSRLDVQSASAKKAFREAYDAGDSEAMASAQEMMSKVAIDQERYRLAKQRADEQTRVQTERQQTGQQQQYQQQQQQQQQYQTQQQLQQAKPDRKATGWAENNEWFGQDRMLTAAALAIHSGLVEEEGFDPTSDEYYTEIDRRIRTEFPHKFASKKPTAARVASASASASKTNNQGRRSVKLSASQVAMAKRLNVPVEVYARYVKD